MSNALVKLKDIIKKLKKKEKGVVFPPNSFSTEDSSYADLQTEFNEALQAMYDSFRLIKDVDSFSRSRKHKMAKRRMKEAVESVGVANKFVIAHRNKIVMSFAQELNAFANDAEAVLNALNKGSNLLPYDMDVRIFNLANAFHGYGAENFGNH